MMRPMLHSTELQRLSLPNRYLALSRSYLEGSKALCQSMLQGDFGSQYANTRVILNLCRHSVELFLKGCISSRTHTKPTNTHNLARLVVEYEQAFPELQYRFEMPFKLEIGGTQELFEELNNDFHGGLDQSYRYPEDYKGNPYNSPEGFMLEAFINELEQLSVDLTQTEWLINETIGGIG